MLQVHWGWDSLLDRLSVHTDEDDAEKARPDLHGLVERLDVLADAPIALAALQGAHQDRQDEADSAALGLEVL